MWVIIAAVIIVFFIWLSIEFREGAYFIIGIMLAFVAIVVGSLINSPEYTTYEHRDQIVSVNNKAGDGKMILELQREGYTETMEVDVDEIDYKDSAAKVVVYPVDHNTDKWFTLWDWDSDGKKIVEFPLDQIKLVK